MAVLTLRDPKIQRLRSTHKLLKGTQLLGGGHFCRVFASKQAGRVLKLTADRAHRDYLVDGCAPRGPFKPKTFEDYGDVGETSTGAALYLLEVERLYPLKIGSANRKLAASIVRFVDAFGTCGARRPRLPEEGHELPGASPSLLRFLQEINLFEGNFDYRLDMHIGNFMERCDGSFVVSDPVYDWQVYHRHQYFRRAA